MGGAEGPVGLWGGSEAGNVVGDERSGGAIAPHSPPSYRPPPLRAKKYLFFTPFVPRFAALPKGGGAKRGAIAPLLAEKKSFLFASLGEAKLGDEQSHSR
jgi:hypothetical protein